MPNHPEKTNEQKAKAQLYALADAGELESIVEALLTPEQIQTLADAYDMDPELGGLFS